PRPARSPGPIPAGPDRAGGGAAGVRWPGPGRTVLRSGRPPVRHLDRPGGEAGRMDRVGPVGRLSAACGGEDSTPIPRTSDLARSGVEAAGRQTGGKPIGGADRTRTVVDILMSLSRLPLPSRPKDDAGRGEEPASLSHEPYRRDLSVDDSIDRDRLEAAVLI